MNPKLTGSSNYCVSIKGVRLSNKMILIEHKIRVREIIPHTDPSEGTTRASGPSAYALPPAARAHLLPLYPSSLFGEGPFKPSRPSARIVLIKSTCRCNHIGERTTLLALF